MGAGIQGAINGKLAPAWELADNAVKWLAAIHERLGKMIELQEESSARDEFHRFVGKFTNDGTGAGSVEMPSLQGWHFELVNIAVTSSTGEAGAALTYMNGASPANLLHVTALGRYTSDAYPPGTFVPQGVNLVISTVGSVASADVIVCILAKKLPTTSPLVTVGGGES